MPALSIIIPTCNRPALLAECLRALAPLPPDCEVIIADDSPASASIPPSDAPWSRRIQGPRRGPAANRNAGARAARAPWLAFLDDDCQPQKGWASALLKEIECENVDVIEGKTICRDKRDSFLQERVENERGDLYWSCNLAMRREIFGALGGFDEDFAEAGGEDMELAWRIRRHALRCRFCAEALVVHPARQMSWRRLWWRTLFIRWHLLYRLKTKQAPSLKTSAARSTAQLILQQSLDLLRTTVHLVTRWDSNHWRTSLLTQSWRWFTFPVLVPYLVYWDLRFRRLLGQARSNPSS